MHKPSITLKSCYNNRLGKQILAIAFGAAIMITSCKKKDDEATPATNNGGNNNATVSTQDKARMDSLSRGNMAEISAGRMAVSKATSSDIKAFGQQMITDHTQMQNELTALARTKNTNVDTVLDAKHQALKAQLALANGRMFDSLYISSQVEDHNMTLKLLNNIVNMGQDQDVKNLANKSISPVTMHRDHAVMLRDSLINNK